MRLRAGRALAIAVPEEKVAAVQALWQAHTSLPLNNLETPALPADLKLPGRPAKPLLKPPKDVPTRSPFTQEGLAA
ncbi:MAG: hypothetical protein RLZZ24_1582, partial [Pseudomonadota bacterium]